uniref:MFS transporter n=1 Tax=Cyberlindnera americana TaxID=36016 RepID=A0A5P8N8C1_9ASCO|nr:MFS transporter [Cyberlindnera americana]
MAQHREPPLAPRVSALIASAMVAVASGTPYVYAVYAPQLVKHAGLKGSQAASLALALSLGGSLGGLPAGLIIDSLGPQLATAFGGIICFIAFHSLHWAYTTGSKNVLVYMFSLGLSGFASVLSFYSTVKCATANFPHHRGSAGALPVSGYALASLLYSTIAVNFFDGNTVGLLRFFSIFAPAVCIGCAYFIHIVENPTPAKRRTSSIHSISERSTLMNPSGSVTSFRSMAGPPPQRKGSMHKIMSLWGLARTPSTLSMDAQRPTFTLPEINESRSDDSSAIYVAVEDVPVFVKAGGPLWDNHIVKAITTRVFVKFYIILACLMGIGQMYIYSVGFVVVALAQSDPENKIPVGESQALQVSTIALFNFLGRLTSGPISDIVRRKFKAQRIWCITFAAVMMGFGQYLVTKMEDLNSLIMASIVIGFAFGFCFGTFPAIVADTFGTEGFTTLWGVMSTSGVLVLMTLCNYLAGVLKSNSDDDGVCTLGAACYAQTFVLTQWLCLFVVVLTVFTIWYNHRVALSSH